MAAMARSIPRFSTLPSTWPIIRVAFTNTLPSPSRVASQCRSFRTRTTRRFIGSCKAMLSSTELSMFLGRMRHLEHLAVVEWVAQMATEAVMVVQMDHWDKVQEEVLPSLRPIQYGAVFPRVVVL